MATFTVEQEQARIRNGLHLFKSLIKDGCRWEGDIFSRSWSEVLYIPEGAEGVENRVKQTLSAYTAECDYALRDGVIWIA